MRDVPVDEHAHPAGPKLAEWIQNNVDRRARLRKGLLFPSRSGRMYSHSALTSRWHRACDEAGVPRVPMYQGTRHSAATHLYADGLRDAELRVLMGHRPSSKHTERYRQIAKRTGLLNAMKRISVARLSLAANHEDPTKT